MLPIERCAYHFHQDPLGGPRCTALGTVQLLGPDRDPVPGGIYCEDHAQELCAEYLEKVQESWSYVPLMTNGEARRAFDSAIAAQADPEKAARLELAREYFCNPEFRSALQDEISRTLTAPRGWEVAETSVEPPVQGRQSASGITYFIGHYKAADYRSWRVEWGKPVPAELAQLIADRGVDVRQLCG